MENNKIDTIKAKKLLKCIAMYIGKFLVTSGITAGNAIIDIIRNGISTTKEAINKSKDIIDE